MGYEKVIPWLVVKPYVHQYILFRESGGSHIFPRCTLHFGPRLQQPPMSHYDSLGVFLFLFIYYTCFFISTNHLTGINDILKLWMYLQEPTMKGMGPNDVKHVVWCRLGH